MRRPARKTLNQLEADVIVWNHKHPVGTEVLYHSVIGQGSGVPTKTTGKAYVLSGHTAVICVGGVRGCVALDALEIHAQ